jgi:hypothetical protein
MATPKTSMKLMGCIFGFLGAGAAAGAGVAAAHMATFRANANQAVAEVVALDTRESRDSHGHYSTVYYPVVSFTTDAGIKVRKAASTGSTPPAFASGDHVRVFYAPSDPQKFYLDTFFDLWGVSVILGMVGFSFAGVGALIWRMLAVEAARRRLKGTGIKVVAELTGSGPGNVKVNGVAPVVLFARARHPITGQVAELRSNNLWIAPLRQLPRRTIDVYFDQANPKRYYVDAEFVEGQAA